MISIKEKMKRIKLVAELMRYHHFEAAETLKTLDDIKTPVIQKVSWEPGSSLWEHWRKYFGLTPEQAKERWSEI